MKFLYSRTNIKYLQTLQKDINNKLIEATEKLPFEGDIQKLNGKIVKNIFRLRIGKYRVIYSQEKEVKRIIKIDTRGDVYK